ncbi:MAG: ComEC/Rec2 family competence protein [Candidatus Melainabacteria bacterium]|jgi:ComEC/Rec2-related protein|nr:ComEC/Rec2 family competence protein [Candidatus Melainabacteria bacterium]
MNLFLASIGTVLGSVYFILGDHRIFIAGLVCMLVSSSVFTSLHNYKKEILSVLFAFLLVFFNYNFRAEHLQYLDPSVFDLNQTTNLEIVTNPQDRYFKSNFIIEIKAKNPSLKTKIREIFLPYRLQASADSSKGLTKGDLVAIENSPEISKIAKPGYTKSQKTFFKLKNELSFAGHKRNAIHKIQESIQRYYYGHLEPTNALITTSLILGSRVTKMPADLTNQIRKLGLGHFFAASGFHLLMLSMTLFWIFNLFKVGKLVTSISIISASLAYIALADFSPSIIRAAIFISIYLILDLIKRKPKSTKLIFYVAGIILVLDPFTMLDLGFQFSYLATLAILTWAKPIRAKLDWLPGYFADIVSVSLSVQILLVPVIIYYFNNLQPWTLIANIIFTPLLSILTLCSFMGLYFIIDPLLNLFRYLVELSQSLPFIQTRLDIQFETVFLLITAFALLIYSWTLEKQDYKVKETKDLAGILNNLVQVVLHSKYVRAAIITSCFLVSIGFNANPSHLKQITIHNGYIEHKEFNEFMKSSANHKLMKINSLKALAIKDRSSTAKIAAIKDLQEVNLLILPKLNASDIYLSTLLDLIKPQFIIASVKTNSQRVKSNLEIIGENANTIINDGSLTIGHDAYWSMGTD